MTDRTKTFIVKRNTSLRVLFDELIDERTQRVLTLSAGEERDRQIEFIKAFKEWVVVLDQFDASKQKSISVEKAI